jgi:O-acetyl-ADP-ribose deacetylase (regulator of RNase III)
MTQHVGKNIFDFPCDAICVTTNGVVKNNGELVMGGGIALQFKNRYPKLPTILARHVSSKGNHCYAIIATYVADDLPYKHIVSFPTKNDWKNNSPLSLIQQSINELVSLTSVHRWDTVALPFPGIGLGGLKYEEVLPLVERLDDRFHLFRL